MNKTVLGSPIVLKETRFLKANNGALQTIAVFEGTEEAVKGLLPGVAPDQAYELDSSENPKWRLTISTPDYSDQSSTDTAVTSYELVPNSLQLDLLEHPKLSGYDVEVIKAIQDGGTGSKADYLAAKTFIQQHSNINSTNALYYLDLYAKGTRHFRTGTYNVRVNQIISKRSTIRAGFAWVNTIYNTPQLLREIGAPSTIGFSISAVTQVLDDPGDRYTLGWLKSQPSVVQVGGGRFQIQLEYELNQWSIDIYQLSGF